MPRTTPRPFEDEHERYGIARSFGGHEGPRLLGTQIPRLRVGLDGILSRLKKSKLDKSKETFS